MISSLSKLKIPSLGRGGRLAAVDFDASRLRVAVSQRGARGTRIVACGGRDLPDGLDAGDPAGVGVLLRDVLDELGCRTAPLVLCVPRSLVVLKPVTLPPNTPEQEYAAMVHFQAAKELPFPAEDAVIDFTTESHYDVQAGQPEGGPQGVQVLAAAIRLSTLDYYRRIAAAAEAKLLAVALRPYADLRCVEACEGAAADGCAALVHLTAGETEIDVISGRSLAFSRAAVRNLSAPGAADGVDPLVQEVARSLQSYQTIHRGPRLDAVLVAGETGLEARAAELLAERLGVPSRLVDCSAVAGRGPAGSGHISALGLATCDVAGGKLPFDFLNPKRPPVVRDKRKTRMQLAALAGVVALLALLVGGSMHLGGKRAELRALQAQQTELEKQIKAARDVAFQVDAIQRWRDGDHRWLDHVARLAAILPPARDVYLGGLDAKADGSVNFVVQARSSEAITDLGERLSTAGYPFRPGQIKTASNKHGYVYGTTVRVMTSGELADLPAPGGTDTPDETPDAAETPAGPAAQREPQAQPETGAEREEPEDRPEYGPQGPSPREEVEAVPPHIRRWRERQQQRREAMRRAMDTDEDLPRGAWNRPNPNPPAPPPPPEVEREMDDEADDEADDEGLEGES